MAAESKIAWTRSTFNPWIGCTKVSPGCDHCYAEALDKRHRWGGVDHWGPGVPRHRTSASYWKQPLAWNRKQEDLWRQGDAPPWYVFCASLADVFDNEVPEKWFWELSCLINATPALTWLLVTKRIGRVKDAVPSIWMERGFPKNVRLLITVCNQEEADRDIPKLLALPCKNGISYEPALGPVNWEKFLCLQCDNGSVPAPGGGKPCTRCLGDAYPGCPGLQWIIVGGESSQGSAKARPFDIQWARDTVAQCKAAEVPVFVKQLGSHPITDTQKLPGWGGQLFSAFRIQFDDRAGADPDEWPADLRVREFPNDERQTMTKEIELAKMPNSK